ncbi:MAG: hypothetical protein FWG43_03795 [Clostridiales bacterium]|nr:hypothetical protein [Clostridiales bacterium]
MNYSFDSVRAKVQNKCLETGIKPAIIYQRYLLERFISLHLLTPKIPLLGGVARSAGVVAVWREAPGWLRCGAKRRDGLGMVQCGNSKTRLIK